MLLMEDELAFNMLYGCIIIYSINILLRHISILVY